MLIATAMLILLWAIRLNCSDHTIAQYPMKLYAEDIDNNGKIDPVSFAILKIKIGKENYIHR